MNGKMLIKVTLNEATDPDLFAYLSQFDNARLRAGAFRSIAGAAVRSDRAQFAAPFRAHIADQGSPSATPPRPQAEYGRPTEMQTSAPPDSPAPEARTEPPVASEPPSVAHTTTAGTRFDTDAIGEQFAGF
jgi:hypothetical protein